MKMYIVGGLIMERIMEMMPYIIWIIVIAILFLPSSKSNKIRELEDRIKKLEKKIGES